MLEITARLLFRKENEKKNFIESTSEEIIGLITNEVSINLNVGSIFFFREMKFKVEKIETHLSEKLDEIKGLSYAKKIGESYPYSISVNYTVSEFDNE